MGPQLDQGLDWAGEADLASAFVTGASLRRLESALSRAREQKRGLKVRAVVGLYQRFTPPDALATLLKLQREFPDKLSVRVARNRRFHWKLYAFRNSSARRFYVGSANLTQDGMTAEGELCIKITAAARDAVSKSLEAEFDRLWRDDKQSVKLDASLLSKYRRVARPPRQYANPEKDDALKDVLTPPARISPEPSPRQRTKPAKPRVCFAPYDLSEGTVEVVESETNWDREGWGYTAYQYKGVFEKHLNAGVLLHVTSGMGPREFWLSLVEVKDDARLDTQDGKYFLAHARVPYSRERRYDKEVRSALALVGLKWARIKSQPALNWEQLGEVCRLLHIRPEKLIRPGMI